MWSCTKGLKVFKHFGLWAWRILREELQKIDPFHRALQLQASRNYEFGQETISCGRNGVRWPTLHNCQLPSTSLAVSCSSCSLIWVLTSKMLNCAYFRHVSGNKTSVQLNSSVNVFLIYPCSKPLDSAGSRFYGRVSRSEAKIRKTLTFSSAPGSSLSWLNW